MSKLIFVDTAALIGLSNICYLYGLTTINPLRDIACPHQIPKSQN